MTTGWTIFWVIVNIVHFAVLHGSLRFCLFEHDQNAAAKSWTISLSTVTAYAVATRYYIIWSNTANWQNREIFLLATILPVLFGMAAALAHGTLIYDIYTTFLHEDLKVFYKFFVKVLLKRYSTILRGAKS